MMMMITHSKKTMTIKDGMVKKREGGKRIPAITMGDKKRHTKKAQILRHPTIKIKTIPRVSTNFASQRGSPSDDEYSDDSDDIIKLLKKFFF